MSDYLDNRADVTMTGPLLCAIQEGYHIEECIRSISLKLSLNRASVAKLGEIWSAIEATTQEALSLNILKSIYWREVLHLQSWKQFQTREQTGSLDEIEDETNDIYEWSVDIFGEDVNWIELLDHVLRNRILFTVSEANSIFEDFPKELRQRANLVFFHILKIGCHCARITNPAITDTSIPELHIQHTDQSVEKIYRRA